MDISNTLNEVLVRLFRDINTLEERAIRTEEYKDVTANDMHGNRPGQLQKYDECGKRTRGYDRDTDYSGQRTGKKGICGKNPKRGGPACGADFTFRERKRGVSASPAVPRGND